MRTKNPTRAGHPSSNKFPNAQTQTMSTNSTNINVCYQPTLNVTNNPTNAISIEHALTKMYAIGKRKAKSCSFFLSCLTMFSHRAVPNAGTPQFATSVRKTVRFAISSVSVRAVRAVRITSWFAAGFGARSSVGWGSCSSVWIDIVENACGLDWIAWMLVVS